MSAQPCGCDVEAGWVCERHREEMMRDTVEAMQALPSFQCGRGETTTIPFDRFPVGSSGAASAGEVRITDEKTGGQKGSKLARFALIPAEFVWALAEHYGKGAKKYEDRNWERGYKWSLSVDALLRHLNQWLMGENNDEETGTNHLIAVAWHACALFIFQLRNLGTNDVRAKGPEPEKEESRKDAIDDAHRSFKCSNTTWCCAASPSRQWICNRPRGHRGRHVAVIDNRFLEEWR